MSESRYALCVTALFLIIVGVVTWHHEMWRDELAPWIIVRHSPSLRALFQNIEKEVHPPLWYLMLYLVNCIADSPLSIQILHWIIAGSIVYVFARHSPFSRTQKVIFSFGYMIFYEYAVVSRNYSIGVLLVFMLCCLFRSRYERFLAISLVIFLLANTSVVGFIVAAACGAALAEECVRAWGRVRGSVSIRRLVVGFYIMFVGCVIAATKCITPDNPLSPARMHLPLSVDAESIEAVSSVAYGVFPIQIPCVSFWDSSVFNLFHPGIRVAVSLGLVFYTCVVVMPKRTVLHLYIISTMGMALFYCLFGGAFYRHYGYHYVMFIAALWMAKREPVGVTVSRFVKRIADKTAPTIPWVLTGILILQLLCSIAPFFMDLMYPFSCGKETAMWIQNSPMKGWMIVGHPPPPLTSVIGYLRADNLYALAHDTFVAFPSQPSVIGPDCKLTAPELLVKLPALRKIHGDEILFIFNTPISTSLADSYGLVEVAGFNGAICNSEDFYIYVFKDVRRGGRGG